MEVVLNGKGDQLEQGINLLEFLILKKLNPETVIVEHNERIVTRSEWEMVILQDQDRLEVLNFVGGG